MFKIHALKILSFLFELNAALKKNHGKTVNQFWLKHGLQIAINSQSVPGAQ